MRLSTENMIAVQFLILVVAITGFLLSELPAGTRRVQTPARVLSWRSIVARTASPWHSVKRLMRRDFWADRPERDATVALETPAAATENSRGQ